MCCEEHVTHERWGHQGQTSQSYQEAASGRREGQPRCGGNWVLGVSLAKQHGKRNEKGSGSRRWSPSSPLGRNVPTGTGTTLPAKHRMAQWKTSKSGQFNPLAARQASPCRAKGKIRYPEEHEMGNTHSVGLTEAHQLAKATHLSRTGDWCAKANRRDLSCAKWAEWSLRDYQLPTNQEAYGIVRAVYTLPIVVEQGSWR